MTDADPLHELDAELRLRTSRTADLPLARHLHNPTPHLPPTHSLMMSLWAAAPTLRRTIGAAASGHTEPPFHTDPIGRITFAIVRWLHAHQQFLSVDSADVDAIRRHLTSATQRLITAPTFAALQQRAPLIFDHHSRFVQRLIARLAGRAPVEAPGAHYSPQLQLRLLGLKHSDLTGSLLDLGCGPHAHLVHHLRHRGVDAWGFDRYAEAPGCVAGDWLDDPPLKQKSWQCITSHQAFSLHFVHHHLRAHPETATNYAIAYRTILDQLPPEGVFAYAPGLPFVERAIDRRHFRVTHPVGGGIRVGGLHLPLATQIRAI